MYKTISKNDFTDSFCKMDRKDDFSYDGRVALFAYLEGLEEETGSAIELNVIAFCCEYSEYEDLEAFKKDYNGYETMEDVENATTVIRIDENAFIIQQF